MATKKNTVDASTPPLIASPIHHGQNIAKLRDLFDWTQKDLAAKLGWRQQKVSELEDMAVIPDEILIEVAKAFGVSAEKLKHLNVKEAAINIFQNNEIKDGGILVVQGTNSPNFHPGGTETILQLTDKLILKEQELREKDKEVFTAQIELEKKSHELTKRELEILQKEIASLKSA